MTESDVAGMTLRYRIHSKIRARTGSDPTEDLMSAVVELIEAERESCLEVINGIYDKLEPGALSRCGGLLLDAAMDIRARSNTN